MAQMMGTLIFAATILACSCIKAVQQQRQQMNLVQQQQQTLERSWGKELDADSKETPIQRVVKLLTEMKDQLEKESKEDQELYDKMVCWCETNEKEKTKAISDADQKDIDLVAEIEERAARHAVLATEIAQTKKEIGKETEALAKAQEIREKEQGEFMQEEKDQIQAVTNLKNAIQVLSKHHGGSLVQLGAPMLSSLNAVLHDVATKHEMMLGDDDTVELKKTRASLIQLVGSNANGAEASTLRGIKSALDAYDGRSGVIPVNLAEKVLAQAAEKATGGSFVQKGTQPAGAGENYAPASGAIFGILKQMKEDFETSLSQAQKDEIKAQEDYAALKATKEEFIAAAKAKLEEMQQEFAANKKAKFDAGEDLDLTRETRTADVEFLRNLKVTCGELDHEFEQRSKARNEEITAVSEAIAIITDDDNADLLRKTVSFLQIDSVRSAAAEQMMRSRAANVLQKLARQPDFDDLIAAWHGRSQPSQESMKGMETPRAKLSALAVSVQLDAFTKVKEAMDQMIAELKEEQSEEVKLKEYCTSSLNQNAQTTLQKTQDKEDIERKMEQLKSLQERLTKEIEESKATVATTQKEIKKASETREKENAEFQTTIADQRATQTILKKVLKKLSSVYKKFFLVQKTAKQTPPGKFAPMKKNAGGSPVIGMIEQIIEESVTVEKEAMTAEQEAQAGYETFVKDGNALIAELSTNIVDKEKAHATAEEELITSGTDHGATVSELEDLSEVKANLHDECDFVLENFDVRQKARLQEIEAIQEAKGILSGA
jgi:hypothetical protein